MTRMLLLFLLASSATAAGFWHPASGTFYPDIGRKHRKLVEANLGTPGQIVRREQLPLAVQDDTATYAGDITWGLNARGTPEMAFVPDAAWSQARSVASKRVEARRGSRLYEAAQRLQEAEELEARILLAPFTSLSALQRSRLAAEVDARKTKALQDISRMASEGQ